MRGLIWKEETRAEKPSEVIWWGVYGGTRVLVKDGGYVSGLWEEWAAGMHIWCEKMVRERKSDRNNEFV